VDRKDIAMANSVIVTHSPLDVSALTSWVTSPAAGAISVFAGTTRESFEGKRVLSLEYEAYEPMARAEIEKLCVAARVKWPGICGIAIHHRLGSVPVGETSVVIAVSSPHRKDAIGTISRRPFFVVDTFALAPEPDT
jgi:molybdopterin synthase catalytic subunit